VDSGAHWKIVAEAIVRRGGLRIDRESQVGRERRGDGILVRELGG
jgi:hypothetical protein